MMHDVPQEHVKGCAHELVVKQGILGELLK